MFLWCKGTITTLEVLRDALYKSTTATKYCYHDIFTSTVCVLFPDLQNVNITLRILVRPLATRLPDIFTNLGIDYDDRVLPSIVNEVLKAVVVSTFP